LERGITASWCNPCAAVSQVRVRPEAPKALRNRRARMKAQVRGRPEAPKALRNRRARMKAPEAANVPATDAPFTGEM
jgi:hypothetical protein